ncbi:MAG: TaqI-like C-terminal specificity domain-containing protein [Nitrospirota bacterium]
MDKKQAQTLIKETLESKFNKNGFVGFVKNLLNDVEEATFIYKGNYIPDAYEQYINTLERIGKYTDGKHKIDILIVKLKKETSIERARTMQRNFVARYLNGSRSGELKDAALVAFVAPNEEDWRFSLVKMDYRFEESKSGRMRVKEEFTPARRWSFLVGVNENSHTAQSQLVDCVADDERNPTLAQLEEAFNIEKVTKEFFEKYRGLFLLTEEKLNTVVDNDKKIKEDFEAKGVETVDFSKKLLGQIVFLYFLQKKGWFGVKRGEEWGDGSKRFLRELFEKKHGSYKNFFNDILEPLFYEALRLERPGDYYSRFDCRIPFLNGGLFDPINNYDWWNTDIFLPDNMFSNDNKTKEGDIGDGILDIFDRYNFTVKEDEPLEKEVAVDPEMLGKVFENLLEIKDRKSKGTYYTPREIVHYMCQQSLINYLATELEGKVAKEDIETLIKHGEQVSENELMALIKEQKVNTGEQKTTTIKSMLPESIRQHAELIDEKLINIKVCDPAIGSGAFPVGMMSEIVKARNVLSAYIKSKDRTIYTFKRKCIEKSLYGVDIDSGAVEIAKLRLWLSLVVDEDDIKQIKPLPNLDYKIMQGNSLISEFMGIDLDNGHEKQEAKTDLLFEQEDYSLIKEFEQKKVDFQNESDKDKKQKLEIEIEDLMIKIFEAKIKKQKADYFRQLAEIEQFSIRFLNKQAREEVVAKEKQNLSQKTGFDLENIEKQLREFTSKKKTRPFFPWKLYFAEVFLEKGGFDVVIANPPWIQSKFLSNKDKDRFRNLYETAIGQYDLFNLFIEKANTICKSNGTVCFITPDRFITNIDYEKIRIFLLNNTTLKQIVALGDNVFENVCMPSAILIFQKIKISVDNEVLVSPFFYNTFHKIKQDTFKANDGHIYSIYKGENTVLLNKINRLSIKFGEIVSNARGVEIGKDAKIISNTEKVGYKPFLRGEDIEKYIIKNQVYINTLSSNVDYKNQDLYKGEKILIRKTGMGINAVFDNKFRYVIQTIYIFKVKPCKGYDEKYLLALLNSKIMEFWYFSTYGEKNRKIFPHLTQGKVLNFPIASIEEDKQQPFINLVDKILAITKDEDYLTNPAKQAKACLSEDARRQVKEYERQIDQMVYQLYDLTEDEIKIIEQFGAKGK